eukprot:scaffold21000_cov42-Attheya_sp.AAC.2
MMATAMISRLSVASVPKSRLANAMRHFSAYPEISKVLIANRGEIACRIMRTCKRLGIPTVAVYSGVDRYAPHVQLADEAVMLGGGQNEASATYLNIEELEKALDITGATAVHPGYGFLSEQPALSELCESTGRKWIGPPPNAMRLMGDKLESKRLAKDAGVSTIPGFTHALESYQQALDLVHSSEDGLHYPIMLKASSGGGGKGMRICFTDAELKDNFVLSQNEARNFFGDDRLLLEQYIQNPHHIEFQVLADGDDVVVFPERECSLQRRNQKILEESPSVLLTNETRQTMARQVKALCQRVGYASAGTVEFMVLRSQEFFFLEMNTRLQVEHPITELVASPAGNVDLVEGMISIAAGHGIPPSILNLCPDDSSDQITVPYIGHAMEARVYAEDAQRGFLPSTGPLVKYQEPSLQHDGMTIRVDSGVTEGTLISQYYDPMVSKLIVHGNSREEAIHGLKQALDQYVIQGVQCNTSFLSDLLRHPRVVDGDTPTNFIEQEYPNGFQGVQLTSTEKLELAALVAHLHPEKDQNAITVTPVIVCLGGMFGDAYRVTQTSSDGTIFTVQSLVKSEDEEESPPMSVSMDSLTSKGTALVDCVLNGNQKFIQVLGRSVMGEVAFKMHGANVTALVFRENEYELCRLHMKPPKDTYDSNVLASPMPGTLVKFSVQEGDEVLEGQELCVVEAMKMQNVLHSTRSGIVSKIFVEAGSSVRADQVILKFAQEETGSQEQTA